MIKRSISHALDRVIARASPHRWSRSGPSLIILTYHRILDRESEVGSRVEPGMYVRSRTFEKHLEVIRDEFEVVDLTKWIKLRDENRPLPKRACVVTFDDGWGDNFTNAFPLLEAYSVPATIFVIAGLVGTSKELWTDRLSRIVQDLSPDEIGENALRSEAFAWLRKIAKASDITKNSNHQENCGRMIAKAKLYTDDKIEKYVSEMTALMPKLGASDTRSDWLTWMQLEQMSRSGIVSVGSHSMTHRRLMGGLSQEVLISEIEESRKVIESHLGRPAELFCFPNGDADTNAINITRDAYIGACTTVRGWNSAQCDPYQLRRISIHEDGANTPDRFFARLSGWR